MFLVFGPPPKRDEPPRCYLHAHIKHSDKCYWFYDDGTKGVKLNEHGYYAEAVKQEDVKRYADAIAKTYGDQLLELIAVPCDQYNALFTIEQMRLLKVI